MTEPRSQGRSVSGVAAAGLAAMAVAVLVAAAWKWPAWQLSAWSDLLPRRDLLLIENELRQTFLLGVAALGLLVWLHLSWRRARAGEQTARATAEILASTQTSQRTERLSKAIEQLAHHE